MSEAVSSWSRRRAAVAQEAADDAKAVEAAEIAEHHAALAEKSDEDVLEELGLPDPDSLVQGDDFKAFMSKAVPAHLRKRALRKLWRSNPVLACVDGLNDYDDDYLTGSTGQGVLKTSYQVGKGMLAHLIEIERQKEAKAAADLVIAEAPEDEDEIADAPIAAQDPEVAIENHAADTEIAATPDDAPRPRRMQFQFEDTAA